MLRLICCIPQINKKSRKEDEGGEENIRLVGDQESDYAPSYSTYKTGSTDQDTSCSLVRQCEHSGQTVAWRKDKHCNYDYSDKKNTLHYDKFKKEKRGIVNSKATPGHGTERYCPCVRKTNDPCSVIDSHQCHRNGISCSKDKKRRFQKSGFSVRVNKVQPYGRHVHNGNTLARSSQQELHSSFQTHAEQTPSVQSGEFEENNNSINVQDPEVKQMSTSSWELGQSINQQVIGYSPKLVPCINITESQYYDVPSNRGFKVNKETINTVRELFQHSDEGLTDKNRSTNTFFDTLHSKRVIKAQDVQRPLNSWLGKLRVLHVGVMVTTSGGEKWLVHKARTNGTMDTTVTDAASMATNWKVISTRYVYGRTLGDFVRAGGLSYNILTNNCWHARKRMMKLCY